MYSIKTLLFDVPFTIALKQGGGVGDKVNVMYNSEVQLSHSCRAHVDHQELWVPPEVMGLV